MTGRAACSVLLLWLPCFAPDAHAVPELIAYQGRVQVDGVNFDGQGAFQFELLSGIDTVWISSVSLPVVNGLYSVLLGDESAGMSPLDVGIFRDNESLTLRISFNDGINGMQTLSPDQPLASVPYAIQAMSVAEPTIGKLSCAANEVPLWDGTQWVCHPVGGSHPGNGSITGSVLCPVDGSIVHVLGTNISASLTASTTSFQLFDVPAGDHTLRFEIPSGYTENHAITVTAGNATPQDVGTILTVYQDGDEDGFGDPSVSLPAACVPPPGYVTQAGDCDDSRASVHPGAAEFCDSLDNDCNQQIDDNPVDALTFYEDGDEDGFGVDYSTIEACTAPEGYVLASGDCDDGNPQVNPAGVESCNGLDDDCDGGIDNGANWDCDDGDDLTLDICMFGQCVYECVSGYTMCDGQCVDLETDPDHCGTCNNPCPAGTNCVNYGCVPQ